MSIRPLAAQEFLSHAKELYEAADYQEALKLLDSAAADATTLQQLENAREYRVLCLLALDRTEEAGKAIEQIVQSDPFFQPGAERPPRLLVMFDRIRRQLLPSIARERYLEAKARLEEQHYVESSAGFEAVLRLIKEADGGLESQPAVVDKWLADLKTMTTQAIAGIRAAPEAHAGPPQPVFRSADAGVTPPIAVRQVVPPWPSVELAPANLNGEIELLIDTQGDVQQARITVPIHPTYDPEILRAAAHWKYRPATKDGQPVAYSKSIEIILIPQSLAASVLHP